VSVAANTPAPKTRSWPTLRLSIAARRMMTAWSNFSSHAFDKETLMPEIKVTCPEDVAKLPWGGNFADDAALFELVDAYLASEPDRAKRYAADCAASLYGMGEKCPDEIPADYK
jgi:hypothetical protein